MKNYVIIGNGAAAVGCIEGIRSIDRNGVITVISAENHAVYCRPLISYYLQGKTDLQKINYRSRDFYDKNGCTVLYGKRAVKIDPSKKAVVLNDGGSVCYDSLCLACGSSPFVPPMEGLEDVKQKFSFMTLDDVLSIEKTVTNESRVLIIGAGLIGLKCAEGLLSRVKSITVCDLADRVLSSIFDTDSAEFMQKHLENSGISFLLGNSVTLFKDGKAEMKNGETVVFDALITAVGVRANTSLCKDAGAQCGRGITINSSMQTTLDGIYAAGDCTESTDISDGNIKIMALMPNAFMQGRTAGINMAGASSVFDNAIPMNSIGFFGLHAMTAGSRFKEEDGGQCYCEHDENHIKKLFTKDGFLTGFVLIGNIDRAGIYTNMIRSHIPISSIDFESLKKSPDIYPFGEDYRRKKLGGVV